MNHARRQSYLRLAHTDANKTAILQKIADLRPLLPFLVNLTPAN